MIYFLSTFILLSILVFVHEFGHFIVAKLSRMRVDKFSIGYPPRLIGKKIGDTDYCISAIPFGGYVKVAGMVDESMDKKQIESEPKPWEFRSKPWINKFAVIFAGAFMNILLAYFIFVGMVGFEGVADPKPEVGKIHSGYPAESVGLVEGDKILKINDIAISTWDEMTTMIDGHAGETLKLNCQRGDSLFSVMVVPVRDTLVQSDGSTRIQDRIGFQVPVRQARIDEMFLLGGKVLVRTIDDMIQFLYRLFTGKESVKNVGGILTIAKVSGESAKSGVQNFIYLLALISINLGILNLLPIPVLDGGHLVILSIEGVLRRELPIKTKMAIQQVGMALLMLLMIVVLYNDVLRVFFGK